MLVLCVAMIFFAVIDDSMLDFEAVKYVVMGLGIGCSCFFFFCIDEVKLSKFCTAASKQINEKIKAKENLKSIGDEEEVNKSE